MPSIAEIIAIEKHNTDSIHLFKEGLFWKAYQRSAYRLNSLPFVEYKLIKKYIKAVGQEVVSLGFPSVNLAKHFDLEQIVEIDSVHLCIQNQAIDEVDYRDWFDEIPLFTPNPAKSKQEAPAEYLTQIHIFEPPASSLPALPEYELLNRLRNFRIEQSTPMECMLFLSKLQKELP